MPLATTQAMFAAAQQNGYAIAAFNIENMEMAQAVVAAATEARAPVIVQTTPSTLRHAAPALFCANVAALAQEAPVPVALHLDHGDSAALAAQALRAGYTSIMIDGSHGSFNENVALTKAVVAFCAPNGVPVEAELGKVGGKEDDLDGGAGGYTDPADAAAFVQQTGVSSLAVAIGTAHGVYKTAPVLDVARLKQIRARVSIPLVLHGASGLADGDVAACIREGVCKVNFATELRIAFSAGVKEHLAAKPDEIDPKKYLAAGRARVNELCLQKIAVCGSQNRV